MNSFRNETAFTNDFGKEEALKCAKAFFKRKNHESKRLVIFGAGEGNRTLVFSLGSWCSTIELRPRINFLMLAYYNAPEGKSQWGKWNFPRGGLRGALVKIVHDKAQIVSKRWLFCRSYYIIHIALWKRPLCGTVVSRKTGHAGREGRRKASSKKGEVRVGFHGERFWRHK